MNGITSFRHAMGNHIDDASEILVKQYPNMVRAFEHTPETKPTIEHNISLTPIDVADGNTDNIDQICSVYDYDSSTYADDEYSANLVKRADDWQTVQTSQYELVTRQRVSNLGHGLSGGYCIPRLHISLRD